MNEASQPPAANKVKRKRCFFRSAARRTSSPATTRPVGGLTAWTRVLDTMVEGISVSNEQGIIVYTNPAEDRLFGYTPGELVGQHVSVQNTYPPEENARIVQEVIDHLKTEGAWQGEFENCKKDGTSFTTFARITALQINEQNYWVCVQEDITERKQIEVALRQSEARYQALFNANIMGVIIAGMTGTVLEANDAFLSMVGYSREELVEGVISWAALTPPEFIERDEQAVRELLASGITTTYEKAYQHKNGTIIPVVVGAAVFDTEQHLALAFVLDISERKRALAEAQEAVRLRDQFLSIAAHELKTPLTSMLGYAQLLQRRAARSGTFAERDQKVINSLVTQTDRLNRMISALLDISRLEQGQLTIDREPVDLCVLATRVVNELQPTLDEHIIQCDSDIPLVVEGDALRLEQVLQNLIGNAIKYSPHGGEVRVEVKLHDGRVALSVTDHGIGIPAAAIPHLFGRFYRADNGEKENIRGTGIGLYVVKEIITLHGGEVEVVSEEGKGSTFTCYLPLACQTELAT